MVSREDKAWRAVAVSGESVSDLPLTPAVDLRGGGANCVFVSTVGTRFDEVEVVDREGRSIEIRAGMSGFLNSDGPMVRLSRP